MARTVNMRVLLASDPKVLAIADHLANDRRFMDWLTGDDHDKLVEDAYEHVRPPIVAMLVIPALLIVWGVAEDRGEANGRGDLSLDHCTLARLDAICGVPGFGEAMASVGWAAQLIAGSDRTPFVVFPGYLADATEGE